MSPYCTTSPISSAPWAQQARDDSVDVFDGEHDATDAQRVHRRVHGPAPDRVGRVELVELDATVAVRGPHEREGGANVLEPDQAVDRRSLDLRLAFELEAEFDEERLGRLEVVDNDQNVVHPLNRHSPEHMVVGGWSRIVVRSRERGSNSRPELYKSPALPTELSRQDLYSRAPGPRIGVRYKNSFSTVELGRREFPTTLARGEPETGILKTLSPQQLARSVHHLPA